MALKDTIKKIKILLDHLQKDLQKAEKGNKAAAQRVRTGTIRLEKTAKVYRKESIKAEKTLRAKSATTKKSAPKTKKACSKSKGSCAKKVVKVTAAKRPSQKTKKTSARRAARK